MEDTPPGIETGPRATTEPRPVRDKAGRQSEIESD